MRLLTLGGLALEASDFKRPQPLLLLAYLALEGPKDRRHLTELFWMGRKDPFNRLSFALTKLRQGAPGAVDADRLKAWATIETDAAELLATLERRELERGVALYRGPFLDGIYLRDWGPELEEWVYGTREFVAGRVRQALLQLAEAAASLGRFEIASQHAERACFLSGAADPDVEDLERIHTLMLAGGSARLDAVQREVESLGLPLGLAPQEARERLREVFPAGEREIRHNLPARGTSFVGRDLEIAEVMNLLADPDCRLVTLTGAGGVGKTRLALEVARQQLGVRFIDGVFYVPLDALTSHTLIPAALAEALDPNLLDAADPFEQIVSHIAERELLLLLDNFEQVVAWAGRAAELLRACPGLKLLVTSRERLNLEEEWIFPVEGLAFPHAAATRFEEAGLFDAVQLFVQRARRARPGFDLTAAELPAVLEICRLLEGAPLGLELAAAWTRLLSCADIAGELATGLDLLESPTRNIPERHRSLRAAFEHSWRLLSPREQQALRRLAVFRGGFRREAAADVAGASIVVLASLVDKSLLRVAAGGRYDRHPLIYQYCSEKAAEHPEERAHSRERHAGYFLALLQRFGTERFVQREALQIIEEELENVRAAWLWALEGRRVGELHNACKSLRVFFDKRGRAREGVDLFARTAAGLHAGDPAHHGALGGLLIAQAWLCFRLGEYRRAERHARRGLELLRSAGDGVGVRSGLKTLASVAILTGAYEDARRYFSETVELAKAQQDQVDLGDALNGLAVLEQEVGNYAQAQLHFEEVLALQRSLGDRQGVAVSLNNLGHLLYLVGRYREARSFAQEGLQLARDLDLQFALPSLLYNLAGIAYEVGEHGEARSLGREALELAQTSGIRSLEANVTTILGKIASADGDHRSAQDLLVRALTLARDIASVPTAVYPLIGLAELWSRQGRGEEAAEVLGFVLAHPATPDRVEEQASRLCASLAPGLSAAVMAASCERGAALELEALVGEVLLLTAHESLSRDT